MQPAETNALITELKHFRLLLHLCNIRVYNTLSIPFPQTHLKQNQLENYQSESAMPTRFWAATLCTERFR